MEQKKQDILYNVQSAQPEAVAVGYEKSLMYRNICLTGLLMTWILGIIAFCYGVSIAATSATPSIDTDNYGIKLAISLVFTSIVTTCSAILGSIHSTTLRSALLQEGKLEYNSNIRFFKTSSKSRSHSGWANFLLLCSLVLSYASATQTWHLSEDELDIRASGVPFVTLGLGLCGQAAITSWSFLTVKVPSWPASPFNTALVALHSGQQRVPNRSILGVDSKEKPSEPAKPQQRQPKSAIAVPTIRIVNSFVCLIAIVTKTAGVIYVAVTHNSGMDLFDSSDGFDDDIPNGKVFGYILAISCLQCLFTISVILVEYQILVMTDEKFWRKLTTKKGVKLSATTTFAVLTNPFVLFLYMLQAAVHWIFGLTISVTFNDGFNVDAGRFIFLLICLLILLIMARYCNHSRPKGPLPVTYGHIQTIVNLIDVWGEHMWWGDKGMAVGSDGSSLVRRAGTAAFELEPIRMDCEYL